MYVFGMNIPLNETHYVSPGHLGCQEVRLVEERQAEAPQAGPLSHLRILDFTALVQGPLATQILGDLGADVVKIERPEGEWSRHWGIADGHTHGQTDSFLAFNRNKRSVTADLKDEATRERILALSGEFDVVVENFRPGVMSRLGLGYEEFARAQPGHHLRQLLRLRPVGPVRDPARARHAHPGHDRDALPGRAGGRAAHRRRDRHRRPVHRAAHRHRHPGRGRAQTAHRARPEGRAQPVQLRDLGPAAGAHLLPEPRRHPGAARPRTTAPSGPPRRSGSTRPPTAASPWP